MGKLIIVIGVIVLIVGLLGIPPIANVLSIVFNSLFSDSHTYYRMVPTDSGSGLAPASWIAAGLLLCGAGFALHRRRVKP